MLLSPLSFLLVLAGCPETGVDTTNDAPVATLVGVSDGDSVDPGLLQVQGHVTDSDDIWQDLEVTWFLGPAVVCGPEAPDSGADAPVNTLCTFDLPPGEPAEITLSVVDPFGETATTSVTLDVVATAFPEPTITAPEADQAFDAGLDLSGYIELAGSVVDPDSEAADLQIAWTVKDLGGTELWSTAEVTLNHDDGSLVPVYAPWPDPGSYQALLWASDEHGNETTASVTFSVLAENVEPTCAITAPADLTVVADGEAVTFEGTVLDDDGDPEDVDVTWTSSLDGELKAGNPDTAGETSVLASALSPGWHLVTLDATDTRGGTCSDEVNVLVNRLPVATDVVITPDPAVESDTLTCSWGYSDDDGDAEGDTSVGWTVDGVAAGTEVTLSGAFAEGSVVRCTVTPHDGQQAGAEAVSAEGVINSRPALTDALISPDPAVVGDTLTCSWSGWSDADGDTDQSTVAWAVNGVLVGIDTTLGEGFVGGDMVTCEVTPHDGLEDGTPVSTSLAVDNSAPVLSDVTLSPDPAVEADTLTCTPGTTTDPDGTSVFTYTYGWTVDGSGLTETGSTLTGDHFDKGQGVACEVTPHDGTESGAAVGSNTVTIGNTAPTVSDVSISPENPTSADDLTCAYTDDDVDGDTLTASISWDDGTRIIGTGTTLTAGGDHSDGETITCTVSVSDGTASDGGSASVTVTNSPPILSSVSIVSTGDYVEGETLTCTPGSVTDFDGDTPTYAYAWSVSGSDPGVSDADLDSDHWAKGDSVSCTATPYDGTDWGSPVTSSAVTIVNTPPGAPAISVLPEDPVPGTDDLQCFVDLDSADADADSVTYTFAWEVDGTAFTGSTTTTDHAGDTVPAENTETDQTWTCTATPNDGEEDGTAATAEVTVSCVLVTWYADGDGDGFGDPSAPNEDCEELQPSSYVDESTDCDDSDANVNPGETEVCDEVDNNCDGGADDEAVDLDGDGFVDAACSGGDDCDDSNDAVSPDGIEDWSDEVDEDCDGWTSILLEEDFEDWPTGTTLTSTASTSHNDWQGSNAYASSAMSWDGVASLYLPSQDDPSPASSSAYVELPELESSDFHVQFVYYDPGNHVEFDEYTTLISGFMLREGGSGSAYIVSSYQCLGSGYAVDQWCIIDGSDSSVVAVLGSRDPASWTTFSTTVTYESDGSVLMTVCQESTTTTTCAEDLDFSGTTFNGLGFLDDHNHAFADSVVVYQ